MNLYINARLLLFKCTSINYIAGNKFIFFSFYYNIICIYLYMYIVYILM